MSHEPDAELASVYALGALEPEDRVGFEAHLRGGCRECETALRDYAEALATLAAEVPSVAPPAAVKVRLLERVAAEARPARQAPTAPREPRPRRRLGWPLVWGATLAAAAALMAYLTITVADLRREAAGRNAQVSTLRAEAARLREELAELRGEAERQQELLALLGAPDTRVVALAGLPPSPSAQGRMWWRSATRRGFFVTTGLPPVPSGKTYQLWVISEGKPISAGVFALDQRGTGTLRVGPIPEAAKAEVFAVTLEPAGGLPAPSGPMYLAGKPG